MNLLLLSWGFGAVAGFVAETAGRPIAEATIGYLGDATIPYPGDAPWADVERDRLAATGARVVPVSAADQDRTTFAASLDGLDAIYVAGGNTFALLWALRRDGGADELLTRVRAGLPYIGCSAGSVITGPSITPVEVLDDPAESPGPVDPAGLGLIDTVPIPHADGKLPPYPPEMFEQVRQRYGSSHDLTFIADDQAIRVDAAGTITIVGSGDRTGDDGDTD